MTTSTWLILGTGMISIREHTYSILWILDTDTMELRYLPNQLDTVDSCSHAEPFLGQIGIFVLTKYQNDGISNNYRQYRTAGNETERTERTQSPGIRYKKQRVSPYFRYLKYWPSTSDDHFPHYLSYR